MSVSVTYSDSRSIKRMAFSWPSSGAGSARATVNDSGQICEVFSVPGTNVSNNYDITFKDFTYSVDHFNSCGMNLASGTTTCFIPIADNATNSPCALAFDGKMVFKVTNAGATKTGSVLLYYR